MPLKFERDVHFNRVTDDAIVWADTPDGKRFQLVIPRKVLIDRFGLKKHFDHAGAKAVIQKHWKEFEQQAERAFKAGASEYVVR